MGGRWTEFQGSTVMENGDAHQLCRDSLSYGSRGLGADLMKTPPQHTDSSQLNHMASVSSVHLPPIHARSGTGSTSGTSPDEAVGSTASLPQWVVGELRQTTDTDPLSQEATPVRRHSATLFTHLNNLSLRDTEICENRVDISGHRGRRLSLPLTNSPIQKARYSPTWRRHEMTASQNKLFDAESEENEPSLSKPEHYKRLGRRHSLPQPRLLERRKNKNTEIENEFGVMESSYLGLNASPSGTDEFQSCAESISNLSPLNEDNEEPDREQVESGIRRDRRFSLPVTTCTDLLQVSKTSTANKTIANSKGKSGTGRPPTPVADSRYWKPLDSQQTNGKLSKSSECIPHVRPTPPGDHSHHQRAGKDSTVTVVYRNSRNSGGFCSSREPTGVTWETAATHKTFSFAYNDRSNQSEMTGPPAVGGVVLRSLQLNYQPESFIPGSEQPIPPNNNSHRDMVRPSQDERGIAPTVKILEDSWEKENAEEKSIRILSWIVNEQAQRTGEIDGQNVSWLA